MCPCALEIHAKLGNEIHFMTLQFQITILNFLTDEFLNLNNLTSAKSPKSELKALK